MGQLRAALDLVNAAVPAVAAAVDAHEAAVDARMQAGGVGAPDAFYDEYVEATPYGRAVDLLHAIGGFVNRVVG